MNDNAGVEVVVKPMNGNKSMFGTDAFPSLPNLDSYRAHQGRSVEVARKLANNGFIIADIGQFSISVSCAADKFENFFQTKIEDVQLSAMARVPSDYVMRVPKKGTPFTVPKIDNLDQLIDRAYIQPPPILFGGERSVPPFWTDKFRLRVPGDVAQLMNALRAHRRGITGRGVKVVMADTGFYHHPFFSDQGYNFLAVTTPDAVDHTTDAHGHGTGECANLLAVAPGINFVGVKMGQNQTLAMKTAVDLKPDIITNSWGTYAQDMPKTTMPNRLRPLYLAVLDAVKRGITVCFAAGNGQYGFPGSMPEVISVGGVMVDQNLRYSASRYTSGFSSTWFPGRKTPDVCGLCGNPPSADYIILPVQLGASLDRSGGWGAFSGTSAAAPMVAGVCALLKEVDSSLSPTDMQNLLKFTARDVTRGRNAHRNNAGPGPDDATGYGLVDAQRAIDAVL